MPYDRESAILTIAACAQGVLDDWGEVKGMDFSESVPGRRGRRHHRVSAGRFCCGFAGLIFARVS
jgi:hypothetical protein